MRRSIHPRTRRFRRGLTIAVAGVALSLAASTHGQQEPAAEQARQSRPVPQAAGPSTQSAEPKIDLAKSFADLAHADSAVREAARIQLMSLPSRDLPALERMVRENLPVAPAQANALKEIAVHVYLTGVGYKSASPDGFLGVRLGEVNVNSNPPEGGKEQQAAPAQQQIEQPFNPNPFDLPPPGPTATTGVVILERMPGFCGARMFQDGDVVLGIAAGRRHLPVRTPLEMKTQVQLYGAGQTVQFEVLRQGQVHRVPVTLDPKPDEADPTAGLNAMQKLLDDRREDAEKYWEKTFAPMLKENLG